MAIDIAGPRGTGSGRFARLLRRGGAAGWDPDEVAAYLMDREARIVRGLAHSTPWAGIDDDTLGSYYGYAAAIIARVAETGSRCDWRTLDDLERAQVSAFRNQAYDHWKRANATVRTADKHAVAFDPERHDPGEAVFDRLFAQPDLITVQRDLLAELTDPVLRSFWAVVFQEQVTFKESGDRLGLTKSGVMSATKIGREIFADHLERRGSGELCRQRGADIEALRAGRATDWRRERAEAHLSSCYACALVYEPQTSAMERGLLGLAPTGLVLRMLARAGDAASAPMVKIAESGTVGRAATAGIAALAVAGAGAGVKSELSPPSKSRPAKSAPAARAPLPSTRATRVFRPVDPPPPPKAATASAPKRVKAKPRQKAVRSTRRTQPDEFAVNTTTPKTASVPQPAPPEFEVERAAGAPAPVRAAPAAKPVSPAANEFQTP